MEDLEIKVCTHRFECDALKVTALQTYGFNFSNDGIYRIDYI